jgi:hypothetical protein
MELMSSINAPNTLLCIITRNKVTPSIEIPSCKTSLPALMLIHQHKYYYKCFGLCSNYTSPPPISTPRPRRRIINSNFLHYNTSQPSTTIILQDGSIPKIQIPRITSINNIVTAITTSAIRTSRNSHCKTDSILMVCPKSRKPRTSNVVERNVLDAS